MRFHKVIRFAIILPFLLSIEKAEAFYAELHSLIAYESALITGVPTEASVYTGEPKYSVSSIRNSICAGAFDEDADRDPRLTKGLSAWIGALNWGTHFWDPDAGPGGGLLMRVENIPVNIDVKNAYQRAKDLYTSAKASYSDDPETAYYLLGRVVHLLTDMATPAHVHLDVHISDSDSSGDDSLEEYTAAKYVFQGPTAGRTAFEADFPTSTLHAADYKNLSDGGHPEEPFLFRLFYDMALAGKGFDSDDASGSLDKGFRRGRSVPVMHQDLQHVALLCSGKEFYLASTAYQMSFSRKRFVLSNLVFDLISKIDKVEGIRLDFSDDSEYFELSDFSATDIGDAYMIQPSYSLILHALKNVAALYRLFWDETHPSILIDESPIISFNNNGKALSVNRPDPVDVLLDIDPRGWDGTNVEVYLWADVAIDGSYQRFYFDGLWHPFSLIEEMKPAAQPFKLGATEGAVLRIFNETSMMPGLSFMYNLCVDRQIDGRYSATESLCSGIRIRLN
jgi:hypothetical protein